MNFKSIITLQQSLEIPDCKSVEHNNAKDRKRKCCLVYVGSVKDLISQKSVEGLVTNDARLILRRKLNGATTR